MDMEHFYKDLNDYSKKSKFIIDGAPGNWLSYADELYEAAEILWNKKNDHIESEIIHSDEEILVKRKVSGVSRTYFLLMGFAFENIINILLVYKYAKNITEGKLKEVKTYKISHLIKEINEIKFGEKEMSILKRMEDAIPYWGRYPVPLTYNNLMPDVGVDNNDRIIIIKMYGRIAEYLYLCIRDGWDSGEGQYQRIRFQKYEDMLKK